MKISRRKRGKVLNPRILGLFVFTFLFIFILVIILRSLSGGVKQPIAFNHNIHAENGLECLDCHPLYQEHASSGKPSLETCLGCHEEPLGESQEEAKLREYIESDKEIEWQRLYRVPEDVFFSHRRHVVFGEIKCNVCHGDIGSSSSPPEKPVNMTMKKCMKCHEERQADNDCIACHK
jgi:hypothetical protein